MKLAKSLLVAVLALFAFSGCNMKEYRLFQDENLSEGPTKVTDQEYHDEMVFENVIAPNDRVIISVYNQSSSEGSQMSSMINSRGGGMGINQVEESLGVLVTQNGTVRLPLIGKQKISGMTEDQAASYLIEQYKKYVRNPYVTVEMTNQRIFVLGEVKQPGVVPVVNGTMNLVEAIARSSDLTDYADRTNIKIIRGDLRKPQVRVIDLTHLSAIGLTSLYLKPNDIVYVQPRAMKGYNMAFNEIAPPFQLLTAMLQPFVNIVFLSNSINK